jgi:hypothetical protein
MVYRCQVLKVWSTGLTQVICGVFVVLLLVERIESLCCMIVVCTTKQRAALGTSSCLEDMLLLGYTEY